MTAFFEHQQTFYKTNYIKNLITLAKADGNVDDQEKALIIEIGKVKGIAKEQIDKLLLEPTVQAEIFLPEVEENRMALLYDFMQLTYADGEVDARERYLVQDTVANCGLRPEIVDHLIDLFQYGTPSKEEWADFVNHMHTAFLSKTT